MRFVVATFAALILAAIIGSGHIALADNHKFTRDFSNSGNNKDVTKTSKHFLTPYYKGMAYLNAGIYTEAISYFDKALLQKHNIYATTPPPSYPTNTHTQRPILTCDQPGHASCYSLGYSKGLLNSRLSCSAATLNSFVIANPSQVDHFCSGYRVAAQQALQQQR